MTEMKKRYEYILFPGIINVSGAYGVGKTTFGLECGAPPSKICWIDDDIKGQALATEFEQMGNPFGKYVNLVEETEGMLENEFHKYVVEEVLGNIEQGQFECIFFDNFSRFENSFHPWILTHQKQFREHWSPMGVIHGSEIWLTAHQYEATILNEMQIKAPLVILTSHLKHENIGGRRTGKKIPDVKRPILEKSLLRIFLRRSDDGSPVPTGIILKPISRQYVENGRIVTKNILPTKVPHLNWERIKEYYENPVGNRPPNPDEVLTPYEMSMLDSSILTDEQKMIMEFTMKAAQEQEDNEGEETMRTQMQAMKDDGSSFAEIAEAFDTDPGTVVKILKGK